MRHFLAGVPMLMRSGRWVVLGLVAVTAFAAACETDGDDPGEGDAGDAGNAGAPAAGASAAGNGGRAGASAGTGGRAGTGAGGRDGSSGSAANGASSGRSSAGGNGTSGSASDGGTTGGSSTVSGGAGGSFGDGGDSSATGGTNSAGTAGSAGETSGDNPCEDPELVWHTANKTNYTSYPDPGSEECVEFNGCMWEGLFAACDDKKSEDWVASHNIVAAFPDFDTLELHDLCLRKGSKTLVVTVLDTCGDSDCDGCCTENQGSAEQLIDIESYTNERWGVPDGAIEWADLGETSGGGCE